jgi:hypothetical protein
MLLESDCKSVANHPPTILERYDLQNGLPKKTNLAAANPKAIERSNTIARQLVRSRGPDPPAGVRD